MESEQKKFSLDFHDFSVLRNGMEYLLRLKEHYPNLKISMFTIPFDHKYEMELVRVNRDKELKRIKDNLDWIQIIPHGLTHMPNEFANADKHTTRTALEAIDHQFKQDGLPYEKGFCAPFWLWNQDVVDVLDSQGWWGAVDKKQPDMIKTKEFYTYSHSIHEPFWHSNLQVLKLHGHMTAPSENNLEDCFLNLMKMPRDAEFVFVTDFIEEA